MAELHHRKTNKKKPKSRAKQRLKGSAYWDVRRTLGRKGRFPATKEIANAVGYTIALAAKKYGVKVSFYVIMANHIHIWLVDKTGNYSGFKRYVFGNIAECVNAMQGVSGTVWDGQKSRGERLALDPRRALEQIWYGMLNPVHYLVDDWREFRDLGLMITPEEWGVPQTFTRPDHRFKNTPKTVTLVPQPVPGIEWPVEEIIAKVDREQKRIRRKRKAIGLEACAKRWHFEPSRDEVVYYENSRLGRALRQKVEIDRRLPRPSIYQSRCRTSRIQADQEKRTFESEHAAALLRFCHGDQDSEFPPGSDKIREYLVKVARQKKPAATMLVDGRYPIWLRGPPKK